MAHTLIDVVSSDQVLPREFYERDTLIVAQELIGKILVHQPLGGRRVAGRIVELEAYLGVEDPAAHTYGGRRTARNESMYLTGGHVYVYQIYGLHFCMNVVAGVAGVPEAVLLRALEPVEGLEQMMENRGLSRVEMLTSGPGRLCEALGVTRQLDGTDLVTSPVLFITDGPSMELECGPRVGVDYAGDAAFWPLRFAAKGHSHVSKRFKF